jgi:hypothetical protein
MVDIDIKTDKKIRTKKRTDVKTRVYRTTSDAVETTGVA